MAEEQVDGAGRWVQQLTAALRRLGLHQWTVLLALLIIFAGTWTFVELGGSVLRHGRGVNQLDRRLLLSLREPGDRSNPVGPPWFEGAVRDVTALGSTTILTFLTLASVGYLLLVGQERTALILLLAMVGGMLLSLFLKDLFARPRPDLIPMQTRLSSFSFPSGHSMMSAVGYLTLGVLLTRSVRRLAVKTYLLLLALLVTLAVGFSRVYLAVHWPSDVLAGWTAGAVWALLVWFLATRFDGGD